MRYRSRRFHDSSLHLANDIVLSFIRNDRKTGLPEHAVTVAGNGNTATRTQEGNCICISPNFNGIAIASKGQGLIVTGDDNRACAFNRSLNGRGNCGRWHDRRQ